MNTKIIVPAFAVLAFVLCQIGASEPDDVVAPVESTVVQKEVGGKDQPPDKKKPPDKKTPDTPIIDSFTRTPTMGNQFPTGFNPNMLGDFGVFFAQRTFTVTGTKSTTQTVTIFDDTVKSPGNNKKGIIAQRIVTTTTPFTQQRTVLVPYASSAAAFKIAENESPRPVDRVFFLGNHFGAIRSPESAGNQALSNVQNTTSITPGGGLLTTVNTNTITNIPGAPRVNANLYREVFGFEKTFLDGFASIELRVPILQQTGNFNGFSTQNAGDLTIIGKYAFLLDNETGNVFSAGLALTVPTGPGLDMADGYLHSTLIQPWFGYIWNADRFFVNAFHSIVIPTDSRDVTLLFNDVGINFWLYRGTPDRMLTFVVPMIECHVTTPLNHRSLDAPIYVPDTVVMTTGLHLGLFRNTTLSFGVATPVTGPRIFNVESFALLNWRF